MKKCFGQKKFFTKVKDFWSWFFTPKIFHFSIEFFLSETFFHFSSMKIISFVSLIIANTLFFNLGVPNFSYFFISLCNLQTNSAEHIWSTSDDQRIRPNGLTCCCNTTLQKNAVCAQWPDPPWVVIHFFLHFNCRIWISNHFFDICNGIEVKPLLKLIGFLRRQTSFEQNNPRAA